MIVYYMKRLLSFLFVVFLAAGYACAQDPAAIPDDSFYEQTQRQRFPVFGMFKETYFVTGIPANTSSIDKHNADVRFQVSLALRVARIDNVDILGTYTETGVWHVYDTSSPLVENAFVHGVKDAAEGAKVAISYEYGPDWFKVIVADSGGGMTEARVEALRRALDADEMPEGSALSNLKRRMEMRYGAGYTLGLACVDGGLTASVTFPRGEEGPGHDVAADR